MLRGTNCMQDKTFTIFPGNKLYEISMEMESFTWGEELTVASRSKRPWYHPVIASYVNRTISGNEQKTWHTYIKEKYDHFDHGCSLGSGIGFEEEKLIKLNLFDKLDLYELSETAMNKFKNRVLSQDDLKTQFNTTITDLNFISLPENQYDFILCNTILHHVINLEHVLNEVNKALKPNGILVINDYCGEDRFFWTEEKRSFLNATISLMNSKYGTILNPVVKHPNAVVSAVTPFEAIRSSKIIPLVKTLFNETTIMQRQLFSALFPIFGCRNFSDWDAPATTLIFQHFVLLDQVISATQLLKPCHFFGIFEKSNLCLKDISPWDEQRIKDEFLPFIEYYKEYGKKMNLKTPEEKGHQSKK